MTDSSASELSPLLLRNVSSRRSSLQRNAINAKISIWLILISAGFERVAFYSLAGNLILFLTSNHARWSPMHAVTVSFIFLGISYLSGLLFAWLSDGKLGRAKTIIIGFVVYIVGYTILTVFSNNDRHELYKPICSVPRNSNSTESSIFSERCAEWILPALLLTAIGVGSVQTNLVVFGADQMYEQKSTSRYFDQYYAFLNVGGLVSSAVVAYVQQNYGFFLGYIVSGGSLVLSFLLFLIGYRWYVHVTADESLVSYVFPVLINAFQVSRKTPVNIRLLSSSTDSSEEIRENDEQITRMKKPKSWSFLDNAKISNRGRFSDRIVDDIKELRRIIVVFLLFTPYWLLYFQTETTYLVQGVHMKVMQLFHKSADTHYMPVIWLSLVDQMIIIVAILILNTFVYKHLNMRNRNWSIRFRIVVGMILAAVSMCLAGTLEIFRQHSCFSSPTITQILGKTNYTAADLSIFYQFPQYICIGLSEVFASVASLEFAYMAAPRSARSLIMSFRFCSAGLSSFLGSIYIGIFLRIKQNFTFENSECLAEKQPELFYVYFFILAGLQFIFVGIFLVCERKYHLLRLLKKRSNTRLFVPPESTNFQ